MPQGTGIGTPLKDFYKGQIGQPGPQYSGDLAPGASPLQQMSFDAAAQFAGPNAGRDAAMQALLSGQTGYVPDTGGAGETYYENNVVKPLYRDYTMGLDAIDARLATMGLADSGVRARALGQANQQYLDQVERGRSEFAYKDRQAMLASRESALDRLGGAIGQSLGIDLSKIGTLADAGASQRQIQGQQMSDVYRRFLEAQPIYNPALGIIGSPAQYRSVPTGGATGASPYAAVLGGLTGGLTGYFANSASSAVS